MRGQLCDALDFISWCVLLSTTCFTPCPDCISRRAGFVARVNTFKAQDISPHAAAALSAYMNDPGFSPEAVKKCSVAAHGLSLWVTYMYSQIAAPTPAKLPPQISGRMSPLSRGLEDNWEAQLASHGAVHESPEKVWADNSPEDIEGAVEEFNSDGRRFFWTKVSEQEQICDPLDDVTGGESGTSAATNENAEASAGSDETTPS